MIELVRDLRVINVLAKFENDPWKIMDVRVLTGLVWTAARPTALPTARPLGVRQYPGALKGCGVKTATYDDSNIIHTDQRLIAPYGIWLLNWYWDWQQHHPNDHVGMKNTSYNFLDIALVSYIFICIQIWNSPILQLIFSYILLYS